MKQLQSILFILFVALLSGCKDGASTSSVYDPSKPVVIEDFSPKEVAPNTRMLIYGQNFGSDLSMIKVLLGGVEAQVIGSDGDCIYCLVPQRADEGSVKVVIGETETTIDTKFSYIKKTVVTTLCGKVGEDNEPKPIDGPFEDCGFSKNCSWLSIDPKNPDIVYVLDEFLSIRYLDLKKREVFTLVSNALLRLSRARTLTWMPGNDEMLISNDQGDENGVSNVIAKRQDAFQKPEIITYSNSCNGSEAHPINGEIYFSKWNNAKFYRYDPATPDNPPTESISIAGSGFESNIHFHPDGKYAYIVARNHHCIYKSEYDDNTKTLLSPTLFCGQVYQYGYEDASQTSARFNRLEQGVFVKNLAYEKAGKKDIYDFYICDQQNHAIRKITPDGMVTTFAGRGGAGIGEVWGDNEGDLRKEARFNQPTGLAFNEETRTFYIMDRNNYKIKQIVLENEQE